MIKKKASPFDPDPTSEEISEETLLQRKLELPVMIHFEELEGKIRDIHSELKSSGQILKSLRSEIPQISTSIEEKLQIIESQGKEEISDFAFKAFNTSEEFFQKQEESINETEEYIADWTKISNEFIKIIQKVDIISELIGVEAKTIQ